MFQDKDCFERFAMLIVGIGTLGAAAAGVRLAAEGGGVLAGGAALWARLRGQARSDAPKVVARLSSALRDEWNAWGKTSSHADDALRASARASFEEVIERLHLDPATLVGQRLDAQAVADLALSRAAVVFPEAYADTNQKNAEARLTRKFLHDITHRAYGLLLDDVDFVNSLAPALWRGVFASQDRIEEKIDAMALSQREKEVLLVEVATLKDKLGTTQTLLLAFLESIRQRAVPADQVAAELFRIASEWRSAGERIDALSKSQNLTPELNRLRELVKEAYVAEDVARTLDLLTQIEVAEEKAMNGLLDHQREVANEIARRKDGLIASKTAKRDIYASQSNVEETVRLTVEIVRLGLPDGEHIFETLQVEQIKWHEIAQKSGSPFESLASIHLAIAVLANCKRKEQRGAALVCFGVALWAKGSRDTSNEKLTESIRVFNQVVAEYPVEISPFIWASAQTNIGSSYSSLADRVTGEQGQLLFRNAITSYKNALLVQTGDNRPIFWVQTVTSLAAALAGLANRVRETEARPLLHEAIDRLKQVLEEVKRETSPNAWFSAKTNLGACLRDLGNTVPGRDGRRALEEAVNHYRSALLEITRDIFPIAWARIQNNLGVALCDLGVRTKGQSALDFLNEAKSAFNLAVLERTRDSLPIQWAMTQDNLAMANLTLYDKTYDASYLREAINNVEAARILFDQTASTHHSLVNKKLKLQIDQRLKAIH